jgi:hypothetical protein
MAAFGWNDRPISMEYAIFYGFEKKDVNSLEDRLF